MKVDLFVKAHHNEHHKSAAVENCCFPWARRSERKTFHSPRCCCWRNVMCALHNYAFYGNHLFTLFDSWKTMAMAEKKAESLRERTFNGIKLFCIERASLEFHLSGIIVSRRFSFPPQRYLEKETIISERFTCRMSSAINHKDLLRQFKRTS